MTKNIADTSTSRLINRRESLLISIKQLITSILREKNALRAYDGLLRQLKLLPSKLQKISVQCVKSIVDWTLKNTLAESTNREAYIWKGEEYLCKMWYDTNFVLEELGIDAKRCGNFSINNPLLLPIDSDISKLTTSPEFVAMMIVADAALSQQRSASMKITDNQENNFNNGVSPLFARSQNSIILKPLLRGNSETLSSEIVDFRNLALDRSNMANPCKTAIEKLSDPPFQSTLGTPRFSLLKKLGEGAFGTVYLATDTRSNRQVAVKEMKPPEDSEKRAAMDSKTMITVATLRDIEFCIKYEHANIVQAYCWYQPTSKTESAYLVMESMECCLLDVIESRKNCARMNHKSVFSAIETKHVIKQVLDAIDYMHSRIGFVHRDIKPENILVRSVTIDNKQRFQAKLCDFGTARCITDIEKSNPAGDTVGYKRYGEEDGTLTDYVGSRWYRAPELLGFGREYNNSIDIWAVGCIVIEMITGEAAFQGSNEEAILQEIIDFNGNPPNRVISCLVSRGMTWNSPSDKNPVYGYLRLLSLFEKLMSSAESQLLADVTSWMLDFDSCCRCSASAALCHTFFTSSDTHIEANDDKMHARVWATYKSHMSQDVQLKNGNLSQLILFLRSVVSKYVVSWLDDYSDRKASESTDRLDELYVACQLIISFQCLCLTKFLLEHNIYSDSTPSHVHKVLSLYFRQNQDLMTGVERIQHYGSISVLGLQKSLESIRKSKIYGQLTDSRSLINVGVATLFHLLSGALRAQSPVGPDRTVLFDDLADYKCIPLTTTCHEVYPSLSKVLMIILGPHDDIETLRSRQAVGIRLTVRRDCLFGDYSSAFSRLFPLLPQIRHCDNSTDDPKTNSPDKRNKILSDVASATSEGLTIFLLEPAFRSSFSNSDRSDAAGVSIEEGEGIGLQKEFFDGISRDIVSNWKVCQDSNLSLFATMRFEVENGTNRGEISCNENVNDKNNVDLKDLFCVGHRIIANADGVDGAGVVDVTISAVEGNGCSFRLQFDKVVSEFGLARKRFVCRISAVYEQSSHQLLVMRRSIADWSINSYWINSNMSDDDDNRSHYRALGGCIAMALSSGARLHLQCSPLFYELLLLPMMDMEILLRKCIKLDTDIRDMALKGFAEDYVTQVMLGGSTRWAFLALHEGFTAAFADDNLISKYGLTGTDIFYALGESEVDESKTSDMDWRSVFHIRYDEELQQCEPLRTALWAAINSMSMIERRQLLKFITGFHSLPAPLTEHLNIEIIDQFNDLGNMNRLPQAHTCDNVLQIPNYYNYLCNVGETPIHQLPLAIKEKLLFSAQQGGNIYGLDRPRNQRMNDAEDDVALDDDLEDPIEEIQSIDEYLAAEDKYDDDEGYENNFEDND